MTIWDELALISDKSDLSPHARVLWDAMNPLDSESRGRFAQEYEDVLSLPTDGSLVPYQGADRLLLDAMTAPQRRRGVAIQFLVGIDGPKMKRYIRVFDPDLPEHLRLRDYRLPAGNTWRDGLVALGFLQARRPLDPNHEQLRSFDPYGP